MIKGTFGLIGSIYSEGRQEAIRKPKNQYECKQAVYQEKTIKMMVLTCDANDNQVY